MNRRAFTLVELAIVIAAVLLLAAIIIPNFEAGQRRTQLSRGKAELRTAAVAIEAYAADWGGTYPYDGYFQFGPPTGYNYWYLPYTISTPAAYLKTHRIVDPYRAASSSTSIDQFLDIRYTNVDSTWGLAFNGLSGKTSASVYYGMTSTELGHYRLLSVGPDGLFNPAAGDGYWQGITAYPSWGMPYDPTNGVLSRGDILRTQRSEIGYLNMAP